MRGPSENLQCKNPHFLLSGGTLQREKIILDLVYMHPGGVRTAMPEFLFWKVSFFRNTLMMMQEVLQV